MSAWTFLNIYLAGAALVALRMGWHIRYRRVPAPDWNRSSEAYGRNGMQSWYRFQSHGSWSEARTSQNTGSICVPEK
jgi:hypothetical protein